MKKRLFSVLLVLSICCNMLTKTLNVSASNEIKITIVHTNDVHGNVDVEPYVKGLADQLRLNNDYVSIISAGDAFAGSSFASMSNGLDVVRVMNAVGYEMMTLGNHEFAMDYEVLKANIEASNFPILGANAETDLLQTIPEVGDYVIKEYGGVKVAYLGLTTSYNNVGMSHGDYNVQVAEELRDKAKEDGAVIFIAVAHLGITDPEESMRSTYLADHCPWLTAIIDAHCHSALQEGLERNGVLIVQTGEYGNNIGVLELTVEVDGDEVTVSSKTASLVKIKGNEENCGITPDEDVQAIIDEVNAKNDAYLSQVVFTTPVELIGDKPIVRSQETNFGDIVADAYRAAGNTDIGFASAVTIRQTLPIGDVTMKTLLDSLGSEQRLLEFELTGQALWNIMEKALAAYPEVTNAFQQISGMKVQFDPTKETGSRIYKIIMDDGSEIDLEKTYSVIAREDMLTQYLTDDEIANTTFIQHGYVYPKFIEYAKVNASYFKAEVDNRIEVVDMDTLKEAGKETEKENPGNETTQPNNETEGSKDTSTNGKTNVVNTGDDSTVGYMVGLLSISALVILVVAKKRKQVL